MFPSHRVPFSGEKNGNPDMEGRGIGQDPLLGANMDRTGPEHSDEFLHAKKIMRIIIFRGGHPNVDQCFGIFYQFCDCHWKLFQPLAGPTRSGSSGRSHASLGKSLSKARVHQHGVPTESQEESVFLFLGGEASHPVPGLFRSF